MLVDGKKDNTLAAIKREPENFLGLLKDFYIQFI